jgi:hypothetical protein
MASEELLHSWARTTELLTKAKAILSPEVAQQHETDLLEVAEFLDYNELGIAFDWLYSIARESQWDSKALLSTLLLAAENMHRSKDAHALSQRILKLD